MIRNLISRNAKVVLKIYRTLRPYKEYFTEAWTTVYIQGNWNVILKLKSRLRVTRIIKKSKILQLQGEIREIRVNY